MRKKRVIDLLVLPVHNEILLIGIVDEGDDLMEGLLDSVLDIALNSLVHVGIDPLNGLQALVFDVLLLGNLIVPFLEDVHVDAHVLVLAPPLEVL